MADKILLSNQVWNSANNYPSNFAQLTKLLGQRRNPDFSPRAETLVTGLSHALRR